LWGNCDYGAIEIKTAGMMPTVSITVATRRAFPILVVKKKSEIFAFFLRGVLIVALMEFLLL
jgi:hypothetical protein